MVSGVCARILGRRSPFWRICSGRLPLTSKSTTATDRQRLHGPQFDGEKWASGVFGLVWLGLALALAGPVVYASRERRRRQTRGAAVPA